MYTDIWGSKIRKAKAASCSKSSREDGRNRQACLPPLENDVLHHNNGGFFIEGNNSRENAVESYMSTM